MSNMWLPATLILGQKRNKKNKKGLSTERRYCLCEVLILICNILPHRLEWLLLLLPYTLLLANALWFTLHHWTTIPGAKRNNGIALPLLISQWEIHIKCTGGGSGLLTSMKRASLEVQRFSCWFADALFSSAQCPEVFSSLGSDVCKKLQDYSANYGQKKKYAKLQIDMNNLEKFWPFKLTLAFVWHVYAKLVRSKGKTWLGLMSVNLV